MYRRIRANARIGSWCVCRMGKAWLEAPIVTTSLSHGYGGTHGLRINKLQVLP
jgi:hypothetical protein